jgi:hypothetical protein
MGDPDTECLSRTIRTITERLHRPAGFEEIQNDTLDDGLERVVAGVVLAHQSLH